MHQQMPAIRGRRNFLDKQIGDAIANIPSFKREVERSLHLPAKLLSFPLCLPSRRRIAGPVFVQSFSEFRIDKLGFLTTPIMLFQNNIPLFVHTHTCPLEAHKCAEDHQWFLGFEYDGRKPGWQSALS